MRISDWSSDVCSSDLAWPGGAGSPWLPCPYPTCPTFPVQVSLFQPGREGCPSPSSQVRRGREGGKPSLPARSNEGITNKCSFYEFLYSNSLILSEGNKEGIPPSLENGRDTCRKRVCMTSKLAMVT